MGCTLRRRGIYDARVGRFGARDVVPGRAALPKSLNPYTYCWNEPMRLVDKDGRVPEPWPPQESLIFPELPPGFMDEPGVPSPPVQFLMDNWQPGTSDPNMNYTTGTMRVPPGDDDCFAFVRHLLEEGIPAGVAAWVGAKFQRAFEASGGAGVAPTIKYVTIGGVTFSILYNVYIGDASWHEAMM